MHFAFRFATVPEFISNYNIIQWTMNDFYCVFCLTMNWSSNVSSGHTFHTKINSSTNTHAHTNDQWTNKQATESDSEWMRDAQKYAVCQWYDCCCWLNEDCTFTCVQSVVSVLCCIVFFFYCWFVITQNYYNFFCCCRWCERKWWLFAMW